jgi:hypothetical protein
VSGVEVVATVVAFVSFLAVAGVQIHSERSYRRRMAEIQTMLEAIQK